MGKTRKIIRTKKCPLPNPTLDTWALQADIMEERKTTNSVTYVATLQRCNG
jgi:hypothetical protein